MPNPLVSATILAFLGVTLYVPIALCEEVQTGGSLGTINENLNISSAQSVSGLYLLGNVSNDGTIQSVCAFGKVNTSVFSESIGGREMVGTIQIFVIRPNGTRSNGSRILLRQNSDCLLRACRDVDVRVRSSDLIVVHIPNRCIVDEEGIECPLQINFQDDNSSTGYYKDSDAVFDNTFAPGLRRVRQEVLTQQPVQVDTFLNVQVTLKDVKLSQLGRVENVYSTDPGDNMTGLYNLQLDIPDDSMITSFCAFGVIGTESYFNGSGEHDGNVGGRLVFFVVRGSDQGPVIRSVTLVQASAMESEVCVNTSININIGSQVSILVAIPSSCVKESDLILCPLQVHFQANDSDTEYYSNSNVVVDDFFVDGNISTIINLLSSTVKKVMTNTSINVRVDIETGVPAEQEFDTCASPDGKIQTTVPLLGSLPTSVATDLQADSLDTVRAVVVPTVIVSFILLVTVLVVVIRVLHRGRSRKRVQAGNLATGVSNDGFMEVNSGAVQQPNHLLTHRESKPNIYGDVPGSSSEQLESKLTKQADGAYYLLAREGSVEVSIKLEDHDYEEPYFEPASEEEGLLQQLRKMSIPMVDEENEIQKCEVLGSGAFGIVHRGVWSHSELGSDQVMKEEVAIKTMEDGANEEDKVKFLQEAAIMGQFNHPNIIHLLGIIGTTNKPLKIVIELMNQGDLRNYLSEIRPVLGNAELPPTLLSYSRQVANGMMYLAVKSFVHRDLAARNVLVSDDGVCKIADFGLSRDLQQEDYYVSHGGKIPVKWTAPEALHYHKYSTASDVWSYGCVLYEIWSLGHKPFEDLTNAEAMKRVNAGFRLPPPPGCPRAVYDVMIKCWNPDASHRPAFLDIMIPLQKPDFQILKWDDKDPSSSDGKAKILGVPLQEGLPLHKDLQRTYLPRAEAQQKGKKDASKLKTKVKSSMPMEDTLEVDYNGYAVALYVAETEEAESNNDSEVCVGGGECGDQRDRLQRTINSNEDGYVDTSETQSEDIMNHPHAADCMQ